jgi:N-acyl-D-aspartate/D-glutamate deacylase
VNPSAPSDHLQHALQYAAGLRMLIEAKDQGRLADPNAIENEIRRIERSVAYVFGVLKGPP